MKFIKIGSKGQITVADLIFSVMIFISIVGITNIIWPTIVERVDSLEVTSDIQLRTYLVSSLLMESEGWPENWDSTNVQLLGIAQAQNVISTYKWDELGKFTYNKLRENLGVLDYDVYIKLTKLDGTLIGDRGLEPTDQKIAVVMMSYVIYDEKISKLYVMLWG